MLSELLLLTRYRGQRQVFTKNVWVSIEAIQKSVHQLTYMCPKKEHHVSPSNNPEEEKIGYQK